MADLSGSETLTPFDLLMPRLYTSLLLTFRTSASTDQIIQDLQQALCSTAKQIPWISGRVFTTEIRWTANDEAPRVVDAGSIDVPYLDAAATGLNPKAIPLDKWPLIGLIDDATAAAGAPVFGASVFKFADGEGVGLCVSIHHHVADASGTAEVLRIWSGNATGTARDIIVEERSARLVKALVTDDKIQSTEDLLASHPEYTTAPISFPPAFPVCTSKIFTMGMGHISKTKERMQDLTKAKPTTNTVISVLLWSAITRARVHRDNSMAAQNISKFSMAVNGRKGISSDFSSSQRPYFGNTIIYSLATESFAALTTFDEVQDEALAKICDAVTTSVSSSTIDRHYVSEIYSLASRMADPKTLRMGLDSFGSRDIAFNSWAGMDLYEMDFGPQLGNPEFVRLPHYEGLPADGVCIVLPRKRQNSASEVMEVLVMLRADDMETLERDASFNSFAQAI